MPRDHSPAGHAALLRRQAASLREIGTPEALARAELAMAEADRFDPPPPGVRPRTHRRASVAAAESAAKAAAKVKRKAKQ